MTRQIVKKAAVSRRRQTAYRVFAVLAALAGKTAPELLPYARKLWRVLMDLSKEFQDQGGISP